MKAISRTLATGVAALAMTAGSLTFTGTAQARAADCVNYLQFYGYTITSTINRACRNGELGYWRLCESILFEQGVIAGHASEACRRSTW